MTIIALIPIAAVIVLLVVMNMPAKKVMPIAWIICVTLTIFLWKMTFRDAMAYSVYGALKGFETLVTILGAVLLLNTLQCSGGMGVISRSLTSVSSDRRIQAIIIGWMFNSFIEGAAGFGTPAALAAPLLVGMGFPALAAAMFTLICNSTAVAFGVVGVPTLTALSQVEDQVNASGLNVAVFNMQTIRLVSIMHGLVGLLIPFIALCMLTRFFGKEKSIRPAVQVLPFAVFAGASFTIPSVLLAFLFGAEFPSLGGALIGLCITVTAARKHFLTPKQNWDFPQKNQWASDWNGMAIDSNKVSSSTHISSLLAWVPYGLITIILVVTRIPALGLTDIVKGITIDFNNLLGVEGLNYSLQYLWLPGSVFIIIAIVTMLLHKMTFASIKNTFVITGKQVYSAVIAMLFGVALVQLMLNSDVNQAGMDGMMTMIATSAANIFQSTYVAISPMIGILGAFISGSNTVSNMLFASMQFETAQLLGLSPILIVALQCIGGGVGNMICINNVVAVCSTVGVKNCEGKLVKKNLIPCFIYCILIVLIAILLICVGGLGLF